MNDFFVISILLFSFNGYSQTLPAAPPVQVPPAATTQTAPAEQTPIAPPSPIQTQAAEPAPSTFFYYCDKAKTYYPNVQQCPDGWIAVPAGAAMPVMQEVRAWPERQYSVNGSEVIHSQPNAVSFEFFGRALLYSVNYDYAITNRVTLGLGISSWESRDWWTGADSTVTVVPVYANYYFSQHLSRGFVSAGIDWISATRADPSNGVFADDGVAAVIGGGYEARDASGYLLRFGGFAIIGKTSTINPSVSVGYAF